MSQPPLPHDVLHYAIRDPTYPWRTDAYLSYLLAYRTKALAKGSVQPATPAEMYWQEAAGAII